MPYTNDVTFNITPISFVDKDFDLDELKYKSPENVGQKELVFMAGESINVGRCLMTIEMEEYDMSKADLELENKKRAISQARKSQLKANFNIPVKTRKYVDSTTKPIWKDTTLNKIVLSSNAVLYKRPGRGFALDKVSIWKLILTTDHLRIEGSNGIKKSYKLFNIQFNETLRMQEFQLADSNGNHTHNFNIVWNDALQQYVVVLTSLNHAEEYKFQQVKLIVKQ